MPQPVRIKEVQSWRERRQFLKLPYRLYAGEPGWVAPLQQAEKARWNPNKNPAISQRWVKRFLALRGTRVLGRIAAIVDDGFASVWQPGCGFFGFFECVKDQEVASALFEAADGALRRRARTTVIGPVNLTTNDEVGFLVEGWGSRPSVLSPYNPPYYADLTTACGYLPARDYLAFNWTPKSQMSPSIQRLLRMAKGREGDSSGTTVRAFRDSDWESDVATLHGLYNEAFRYLWGFVPMSAQEFAHQAQTFRPFYKPSLIAIAEDDEGPVGFAVVLPDINEALSQLNGRLFPTGWIALLRGIRRIQSARFLLLGVLPGHRGRGIAPLMSERLSVEARRLGVMKADIALVQSSNRQMLHVVESMGCVPSRRFRLFSKDL